MSRQQRQSHATETDGMSAEQLMQSIYYWIENSNVHLIDNIGFRETYEKRDLFSEFNVGVHCDTDGRITVIRASFVPTICKIISSVLGKAVTPDIFQAHLKDRAPSEGDFLVSSSSNEDNNSNELKPAELDPEQQMKCLYYWLESSKIYLVDTIGFLDTYENRNLQSEYNVTVRASPDRKYTVIYSSFIPTICRIFTDVLGKTISPDIFNSYLKSDPPK
ncbi:hypothetical protein TRFO_31686 [Tritrichomonas foetus]|uniref:Uncharacterized protein n=1 Tax=Tritrichomonas foetus TaxID=1144522 RepID=A0A1J4JST5_9EUKA|nr:hypothetical protein TRFO_31686 [Tritrichomonas foetus]|eukprot:OHT01496.1 hypothetical protein TRFO_31686 [Tritrichomonas foetus]